MATTIAETSWIAWRPHPEGYEACIRDTNIHVWGLVAWRQQGLSDEEILSTVQGLTRADLDTAWDYYAAHPEEVDRAIRLNETED
jgi:uncharacterized protein (DUF433 family)